MTSPKKKAATSMISSYSTLQELFIRSSDVFADEQASCMQTKEDTLKYFSYKQVRERASKIAGRLLHCGVASQETVGIYVPNSPEWAMAFFGIQLVNGIAVPMDVKSGGNELMHMIGEAGLSVICTVMSLASNLPGKEKLKIILLDEQDTGVATGLKPVPAHENDVAAIIYTSGSTDQPKGVMLTHRNFLADLTGFLNVLPLDRNDRFLSVISLSHSYELTCGLLAPYAIGACVIYARSLKYTTLFRAMVIGKPTIMYAVPIIFQMLLETLLRGFSVARANAQLKTTAIGGLRDNAHKKLGGAIRFFVSGGAPLAVSTVDGFKKLGIPLLQAYGMTETAPVLTITPPDRMIAGSVGRPLANVEIRIDKKNDRGIGEICCRGDMVMKGYHNNPSATAKIFKKGWLHTGDLGSIDNEGFVYITGRIKNVIVTSAGVNVYPEELEMRIIKSPFIKEVCVVGKQSPDMTETVHSIVVVDDTRWQKHVHQELIQGNTSRISQYEFIRREIEQNTADLASYKKVHDFQIRAKPLPRTRTNKIDRARVRREAFTLTGKRTKTSSASRPIAFVNASVITPFRVSPDECLLLEGGTISQFGTYDHIVLPPGTEVVDCRGKFITPGFIDLHVHGGGGASFQERRDDAIPGIERYFVAHGTTGMLATVYVDERELFLSSIDSIARYSLGQRGLGMIHGVHIEGPFINKNMKGALSEKGIWEPTIENWRLLSKTGRGCIRMMTIAPELPGAIAVMQAAVREGVILSIAHSEARYEDIQAAIENGLSQVTHIFNAMHPLHHRDPGVLGGALLSKELKVHLIADGIHVHPAVVQLLYAIKGSNGIILITDSISAGGEDDGVFYLADRPVTMRDGKAFLDDGTLAGITITLDRSIKFLVEKAGIPLTEAVRMATLNPARVLGLEHRKGIIAVGKDADLVVLDDQFEVAMTVIGGTIVYRRS